ncbi:MAG TPA: DinB family protein [Longimicrobiales bacterium]
MEEIHVDEKSLFTDFWTNESKTTRNVLARIPEGSDYRPDPKSRTAQEIAWQIVCEEKMIIEALETGRAEWAPPPMPATMKDVLDEYEKQSATLPQRWKDLSAERWDGQLEFFGSERPASPMAWSFLFDIVHHRGQITTYLRPMGSTVPQIYGPSADEP